MKNKITWLVASCSIVVAMLLASCSPVVIEEEEAALPEKEEAVTEEETPTTTPTPTPTPAETEELWWKWTEPTGPTPSAEADIPIIDAHSQVDQYAILAKVIPLMDEAGVALTILASRAATLPSEEVISLADNYPGRIVPAVRTKGPGYEENDERYYKYLKKQVNMPGFGAMAEVLMYHAEKLEKYHLIVIYPDDERVQAALDYAIQKRWPFVVSIEFASAGALRDEFMAKLEALFVQNPKHPFVMNHMGQLDHVDARRLIEAHPNVHFTTSHSNPIHTEISTQPWTNMFDDDRLSADWKQLMTDYPDRFIMGFDNVFAGQWGQSYLDQVALWREAIKELPVEVAHAFAHGNAERLWRLPPVE